MININQLYTSVISRKKVDLFNLTDDQLSDPFMVGRLDVLVRENLTPGEAHQVLIRLSNFINDRQADSLSESVRQKYENIIIYLRFIALIYLNTKELENIFQQNLLFALREGIHVFDIIEAYIIFSKFSGTDDDLRQMLISAIRNNDEMLGKNISNLILSQSAKPVPNLVQNWIKDYLEMTAESATRGTLEQSRYLSLSKNSKFLSVSERVLLSKIIQLYDYLNFPNQSSASLNRVHSLPPVKKSVSELSDAINEKSLIDIKKEEQLNRAGLLEASVNVAIKPAVPQVNISSIVHTIPQAIKSAKPALVFNIEDEKEVDKHRDKAGTPPVLEHVLRAFVDEVIKQNNLVFRDEVNQRRFVQLMVSRLKDVRGPLEIAETLRKPTEAGGLGMAEEKADQVQGIMEEAKREFENKIKNQTLKIPEPIIERPASPAPVKVVPPKPTFDEEAAKAWREQMLREIQAQTQPVTPASGQVAAPKPQLADVKVPPKVVGPLEELRGLNLVDFRRLGSTPQEALQKIKSKIDLLGETSITRRVEAVRAWKSSVVYQQYLSLGRKSIEQGKSISIIVGEHQNLGDVVLTENEFTAIADFNSQLRF